VPNRLPVLPQYLFPKRTMTSFAGVVAGAKAGSITTGIIRWFVGKYNVNMAEAANPDITSYSSFNEFFTRALVTGARPLDDADFICPVDGAISQFGTIEKDQIFQAKGHNYSTTALVGGDEKLAAQFEHGSFATLYLSPRDYHRIHMPCDARLLRMIYVGGDFFSVNPTTALGVPNLFARNERVVCLFDSAYGPFILTLVGATIVGSIETVWHGVVNRSRKGTLREWSYDDQQIVFKKGDEMGRVHHRSTVVVLFEKYAIKLKNQLLATPPGSLGESMGAHPKTVK
jgi:phosphatidylserine decarboxylase